MSHVWSTFMFSLTSGSVLKHLNKQLIFSNLKKSGFQVLLELALLDLPEDNSWTELCKVFPM